MNEHTGGLSRLGACALAAAAVIALGGCGTSKWALDDEEYAARYDKPYSPDTWKKSARMAKQLVDARHVEGKGGLYLGGALQTDPAALGGEIGVFYYPQAWISGRAALSGLLTSTAEGVFAGGNVGVRVQPPTRLAPFVGVGGYGGLEQETISIGAGNDEEYRWADDAHENTRFNSGFAAVYPETGVHFWVSGHLRLTASAAYYVTTQGRDDDFWFFGLGLGVLGR